MAQHDYVIANGTGAAVRSDLNNALAAIVSQNSGAVAPTTTYAYMPWADTTTGLFKIRNAANNGWITLYQLDGEWSTLAVENGSAAAPSIYFKDSGTDTGFYSSGTDALDFTTAGTRRLGVSSGGDVTVYGGNTTLNAQGDLRFADADSSNWVAFQGPATVSSNVTWTLPPADGTSGQVLSTNGSGTLSWAAPTTTSDKISEGNTEAEVIDTGVDGHFKVTTEGSERFRCDSSGRLLVGTSTARAIGAPSPYSGSIQVETTNLVPLTVVNNTNDSQPAYLLIGKSRGSIGGNTIVQNGDGLGFIGFAGADGTDLQTRAASISCEVDGTPGANDMPGRLIFATTADGASSPTEQMRITNNGELRFNSGYGSVATAYGCRAWVNFNGTGTVAIRSSGNVSSITDNGVGDYTVNFTTAIVDANYAVAITASAGTNNSSLVGTVKSATQYGAPSNQTTTACQIVFVNYVNSLVDTGAIYVAIFR